MLNAILTKIFGTKHERETKSLLPAVAEINALEPSYVALTDEQLQGKTAEFRAQLAAGRTIDDLLPHAFAAVREVAKRKMGMRHYDVQLIGGMILHRGKIAEMKTGEGKTLVATLPVYLNALEGKGVHVVTVNDYLAARDAEWMRPIYEGLGMTVGVIQSQIPDSVRRAAYACDITYGTNNEIGFDYLRDNMKFELAYMVQRGHHFAIVDEVDSILIDEARTPLIISGPSEESTEKYHKIDRVVPKFIRGEEHEDKKEGTKWTTGDFLVDEKAHTVSLTEEGVAKAEKLLSIGNLYDIENIEILHAIDQALRAHHLYKRDVDYLMQDGKVVIVDEFTGRTMPGRRWSDGLHQAVEAKEGVNIEKENQTLATITFQNLFRMYKKLAGMTGTADTEAAEFGEIYNLDVTQIPTNRPMVRQDNPDVVYRTEREKWLAVVDEIKDCQERGQPALVGTVSIEKSEMLSELLKKSGVRHVVLNAKFHEREASIVAQAGRKGAVTIATNMAGRGTDILLGGNPEGLARGEVDPAAEIEVQQEQFETALARFRATCANEKVQVLAAGGLHILGTERHESRRIDNQLRGRSGRQGDPGSSRFFISLDDDLMRIFGDNTARVQRMMGKLGMEEGEAIEHNMVSRAIERAQKQVEGRNFEVRKHLLKYDDVMNKQREAVYAMRREILEGKGTRETVMRISEEILEAAIEVHCADNLDPRDWSLKELATDMLSAFDIDVHRQGIRLDDYGIEELREQLWRAIETKYQEKETRHGESLMRAAERGIMLKVLDDDWKDHLLALDHLKEGIGLRGYAQKDPLNEFKKESFDLFTDLKDRFEDSVVRALFRVEPISETEMIERRRIMEERMRQQLRLSAPAKTSAPAGQATPAAPVARPAAVAPLRRPMVPGQGLAPAAPAQGQWDLSKVGRNDVCPCGSGKKFKKCHGAPQVGALDR
jgi:preprotein translocase subunit SecA